MFFILYLGSWEIFRWIKRYHNADHCFVLLQETHSTKNDEHLWQKEWGSTIKFSHGTSNSKGFAILFPSNKNMTVDYECLFD